MSPQARPDMVELSFEVPDRLVGQVYIAIGAVLKRGQQSTTAEEEPEVHDWGRTEAFADEAELADVAWRKFSPRAQAVFALLMENPGVAMQADEIAVKIGLANGRHGLAGVVAWPSRQCAEMGRTPPFRYKARQHRARRAGTGWIQRPRSCSSRREKGHWPCRPTSIRRAESVSRVTQGRGLRNLSAPTADALRISGSAGDSPRLRTSRNERC